MLYFKYRPLGLYYFWAGERMKREEKNALSRQRILDAAMREFSDKGYTAASLNTICSENSISKGIIYHYFKDKDELYLLCAAECFDKLTEYLKGKSGSPGDAVEKRLQLYFDARLRFFTENPIYLGIFLDAALSPPAALKTKIAEVRKPFDNLNIATMTELMESEHLRDGISREAVVDDFRLYMDFFNASFRAVLAGTETPEQALREHEERCHRQLGILLYGVMGDRNEKR